MRWGIAVFVVLLGGCSLLYEPEPTPPAGEPDAAREREQLLPDGSASFGSLPDAGREPPDASPRTDADLDQPDAAIAPPDAAPPAPDAAPQCPAQCTGGCDATSCVVACVQDGSCDQLFTCPDGFDCTLFCAGDLSCSGDVSCPVGAQCELECVGADSCIGSTCGPSAFCAFNCAQGACGL